MNEVTFACALSNMHIRTLVREFLIDVAWKSSLAQSMIDFYRDDSREVNPSIAELRTHLSLQFHEDEINKTVATVKEFMIVPANGIDNILADINTFYKSKILTQHLEKYQGDASQLIDLVSDIKTITSSNIPVRRLSELDVDKVIEEELGGLDPIPTSMEFIKRATPWQGYLRGQVVLVVASPGAGKTLWMINEAVEQLRQGQKVVWMSLGDMFLFDFITRFTSVITGVPYSKVSIQPKKYFNDEVKALTRNLRIISLPAGQISAKGVKDLLDTHVSTVEDYDVFVLDYDSNVANESESMYEQGGVLYDTMTAIARPLRGKYRLVMIASQPKIHFWDLEELPKESAGESSRKQAIIDIMITIGRNTQVRTAHAGIIKAAKVRRGTEGEKSYYRVTDYGKFEEIDKQTYVSMKTFEG